MSFFMLGVDKKFKKDNKLLKLNLLLDWSKIKKHLKRIHKNDVNPKGAVVDATIIESAARPRKTIKIEEDRVESGESLEIVKR